jgi:hypothetical protein
LRERANVVKYEPQAPATHGPVDYVEQSYNLFHHVRSAPEAKLRASSRRAVRLEHVGIAFDCSMTTATVVICGPAVSVGGVAFGWISVEDGASFTVSTADRSSEKALESAPAKATPATNPILEMRSTRRALRDKAREVISDFERDHPW